MKVSLAQTLVALLLLTACGKPAPPRDLAKMAAKIKVGMTKPEVIAAIGNPDDDTETDPQFRDNRRPGYFILAYRDLPKVLTVSFRENQVARVDNIDPPNGLGRMP